MNWMILLFSVYVGGQPGNLYKDSTYFNTKQECELFKSMVDPKLDEELRKRDPKARVYTFCVEIIR